jgi:hypothetical protein
MLTLSPPYVMRTDLRVVEADDRYVAEVGGRGDLF